MKNKVLILNQKTIREEDLAGMDGETVEIGLNVENIEEGAFAHGNSPFQIHVQDHPYYSMKDHILVDQRNRMILAYCGSDPVIRIPEEAEGIGSWAFYECQPEQILFPSRIDEIHSDAFTTCRMKEAVFSFANAHVFFPQKDIRLRQYMLEGFGLHGMFDFDRYDESIAAGYIESERLQELTARLKWPCRLSRERQKQFRTVLEKHLDEAVIQLGNAHDYDSLHWLTDLEIINRENRDHVLQVLHSLRDLHAWMDLSRYCSLFHDTDSFDFSI